MANVIDFGKLKITIEESASEVIYRFHGEVDEHFRQKDVPRVKKPLIRFHLEHVVTFNSCGIREWIFLVKDIGELGTLQFEHCSVSMIDQINMVPDSLGKGDIVSFYAPYFCSCGGEVNRLVDVSNNFESLQNKQAPEFKCETCGKSLQFDALEDSYFLFTEQKLPQAS